MKQILVFLVLFSSFLFAKPMPIQTEPYIPDELEIAIKKGDLPLVESLLDKFDINGKYNNSAPLSWAIIEANFDMVELLVNKGALLNTKKRFFSPLHQAAKFSNRQDNETKLNAMKILKFLVNKGADVNIIFEDSYPNVYFNKFTPIFLTTNNPEAMKFLIDNGAKVDLKDLNKNTILHYLAYNSDFNLECLKMLLESNININAKNSMGLTMLHYISNSRLKNKSEVMKLLIKKGADVNAEGYRFKEDVLNYSIGALDLEAIETLLKNGANPNTYNTRFEGWTSLHSVISNMYPYSDNDFGMQVVKLLLKYGANINALTTTKKETPLDMLYEKALMEQDIYYGKDIKEFENLEIVKFMRQNSAKFSNEL